MIRYATALFVSVLVAAAPASAQEPTCRFLCEPTLTFEKDATVFETIFALDLSTPMPRVGVTLEAITKPFRDENHVELESPPTPRHVAQLPLTDEPVSRHAPHTATGRRPPCLRRRSRPRPREVE